MTQLNPDNNQFIPIASTFDTMRHTRKREQKNRLNFSNSKRMSNHGQSVYKGLIG